MVPCIRPFFYRSKLIRFGSLDFRDNWGWPCTAVRMWLICSNRKLYKKKDIFATVTVAPQNKLFSHRLSDHLHCTNIPFTYLVSKDMPTHFRRSKRTPFRENVSKRNITQKQSCYFQRWATATLLIASLPLSLFVEFNSDATASVTEQK